MDNKYEAIMKEAKLAARDILRTRWISNLLASIQPLKCQLENITAEEKSAKFELDCDLFDASQATKEGNPRAEALTKDAAASQASYDTHMKALADERTRVQNDITETEKKIAQVTSGELKVSYDNMVALAKEIAQERIETQFKNGGFAITQASS